MRHYGGVTKVTGICGQCESDLVLYVSPDVGPLPTSDDECDECETTDFRVVS